VLKGAAASSIYGSKAANGVVVITTVRGQAGAPRINVTQRFGVFTPLRPAGGRGSGRRTRRWRATARMPRALLRGQPNPYFDHYAQVYDNRDLSYETVADVSGGTENTRYLRVGNEARRGHRAQHGRHAAGAARQRRPGAGPASTYGVERVHRSENDRGWNNNCNNYGCHGYAMAYIPSFVNLESAMRTARSRRRRWACSRTRCSSPSWA
jgi:TonB-dependent starch-binding outer membrane protein SusC